MLGEHAKYLELWQAVLAQPESCHVARGINVSADSVWQASPVSASPMHCILLRT